MARSTPLRWVVSLLISTAAAVTGAQESTFRITQVYSNLDGSVQYIELTESAGLNAQHRLAGLTLSSTHNGVVKRFTFPHDLPTDRTARMSIVVSTSWLWISNESAISPDVLGLPPRFIPTDGGTLEFEGIDHMTYTALPTDGVNALHRDTDARRATIPSNGRCPDTMRCAARHNVAQSEVFAIEYYHDALDHYFLSASAPDIDALDSGRLAGWRRTGHAFHVGGGREAARGLEQPVCRLYIPPGEGDSHFFSASEDECEAALTRFPRVTLETSAAFYATLPDQATGDCGTAYWPGKDFWVPLFPVYRLWNARSDSNHRYTTNFQVRWEMILRGYRSEGYGPNGVAMCVLPSSPWDY